MKIATWMTTPHFQHAEIARDCGFEHLVLDIEHGTFDLGALDRFIGFAKALGMGVHAKVLGPTVEAIQQALDFGADSVIIPHILDAAHAEAVCAAAKYPPLGRRSFAGGRCMGYTRQSDDFFPAENVRVRCWPMCETAESLADIENILKLPTVDGIFMGPSDLSLSRGRPNYHFTDDDPRRHRQGRESLRRRRQGLGDARLAGRRARVRHGPETQTGDDGGRAAIRHHSRRLRWPARDARPGRPRRRSPLS